MCEREREREREKVKERERERPRESARERVRAREREMNGPARRGNPEEQEWLKLTSDTAEPCGRQPCDEEALQGPSEGQV